MAEPSPLPGSVRGILGTQASEDLVTWLGSAHEELRAGIRSDMQTLIKELDEKLSNRIAALDEKLCMRIHQLELRVTESKADLIRWSFVFWFGAVVAIAALAGVLRAP